MSGFDEWKAQRRAVWGSAPFELAVPTLARAHERLVALLRAGPGVRWLDLATGTGAVVLRAAAAGAEVTAQDFAQPLVETARRLAAEQGLAVRFDVGDLERLPYADASFDVVSSSFGAIFTPDHGAVARELARVCRPGGRIGLTAWRPDPAWDEVYEGLPPWPSPPEGAGDPDDWGRDEYVAELLGDPFELSFLEDDQPLEADSGEDVWRLLVAAVGPMKAFVEGLDGEVREEFRRRVVAFGERHRRDRSVVIPRTYVVILGRRR